MKKVLILFMALMPMLGYSQVSLSGKVFRSPVPVSMNVASEDPFKSNSIDISRSDKKVEKYRVLDEDKNTITIEIIKGTTPGKIATLEKSKLVDANKLPAAGFVTGTMTAPIKIRPGIKNDSIDVNWTLSTDVSLGQYFGYRFPLSKRNNFNAIVNATFGTSLINLNDNTVSSSSTSGGDGQNEGTILGLTGSFGAVIQVKDFQFGCSLGKDFSPGELGRNWIYHGKTWLALGFGVSILKLDEK